MKRILTVIATLGATVATPPAVAQSPSEPEHVVSRFHTALAAGDSARALELLDPGVIIYEGGGVEASRDEYRSHHLGADMAFAAGTERTVVRQTAGQSGDVAWVLTESTTTGTFRDREINARGTETMVLGRVDGQWRIRHIHWSSRAQRSGS